MKLRQQLAKEYRGDLALGLTLAALFLIVSSVIVDGGQLFQFVGTSALVYCTAISVIVWRRPQSPTKMDLWFIRFGFFVILLIIPPAIIIGWKIRG